MALDKLETTLDSWYKKAPQMSESSRKSLAGSFWWLALILGILQVWGAWALWQLADSVNLLNQTADYVNEYFGYNVVDNSLNFFFYAAVIVITIDAVLLLLATPALKAWKKIGWRLLFYSMLLNVVYGLIRMFSDVGGGFGAFLWSLLVTAVLGYFIFQVRSYFTKAGGIGADPKSSPSDKPKLTKE